MIMMAQPSLLLNSHDVPGYRYKMWQSWDIPVGANATNLANLIHLAIDRSPELELKNVIINCHGLKGKLFIGGNDSNPVTLAHLDALKSVGQKGAVGTIWLVACLVAEDPDPSYPKWLRAPQYLGSHFCTELAKAAGCDVVAADAEQKVELSYAKGSKPSGSIDDFEGTVFRFSPSGSFKRWLPGWHS